MRIAHVSMFYYPTVGGVEQVIYELAKRQAKEGHEVHIFCCDSDKNKRIKRKEEVIEGIHIHRIPYWLRLSLNTFVWPGLITRLLFFDKKFDIVHSHVSGHDYILFAGIISKIRGFNHIHTTHCPWTGPEFRPFYLRPFLFLNDLFLNSFSFKFIDRVVAITPWEKEMLESYSAGEKMETIPNGVDDILYKKISPNRFKQKNKIKEKKLVLFFGRLNPTKGPEVLAKAAINISKKRNDVAFVWVGPDEGKAEEVKSLIKPYRNMKYIGPIKGKEKIAEMYQAADVYVLPSYREGLPLTLFESMASGLPIVASPVNGVPYEISEPENGLFVNYGDVDKLEEKILLLLDDPKFSKKISGNNVKKSKKFLWDDIYKRYMKSYQELIED